MNSERWEPVRKCQHKTEDPPGVVRVEYGDLLTVRDELGAATVELPDDLRLCRRVPYDPQPDNDESNSDRYYRGFNDGYEYAKRQEKPDE